eukprot:2305220-Rhodomonas_salina.3
MSDTEPAASPDVTDVILLAPSPLGIRDAIAVSDIQRLASHAVPPLRPEALTSISPSPEPITVIDTPDMAMLTGCPTLANATRS